MLYLWPASGAVAHGPECEDRAELLRPVQPEPVQVLPRDLALEPGRVHQQPPDRQVLERPVRVCDPLQLRQEPDDRVVQAEVPSSRSCMTAVAVIVLVIDATRYRVRVVGRARALDVGEARSRATSAGRRASRCRP